MRAHLSKNPRTSVGRQGGSVDDSASSLSISAVTLRYRCDDRSWNGAVSANALNHQPKVTLRQRMRYPLDHLRVLEVAGGEGDMECRGRGQ